MSSRNPIGYNKPNPNWVKILLYVLIGMFILFGIATIALSFVGSGVTEVSVNSNAFCSWWSKIGNSDFSTLINGIAGLSWSVVGVFLLCLTLYYQRYDFKMTKITSNKQQFETTFFNMLSMLIEIRNSIHCVRGNNKLVAHEYLSDCIEKLKNDYLNLLATKKDIDEIDKRIEAHEEILDTDKDSLRYEVQDVYESFYSENHNSLGHYFRYIYHIIEFILRERGDYGDANLYMQILQAQLSDNELSLLFYNALSKYARKKENNEPRFYKNMELYGFLENVDSDSLMNRTHYIFYPKTKFKFLNADELRKID